VSGRFRQLPSNTSADALEQEVLGWWREERLFEQSVARNAQGTPFIFYDGPPTANGRPGIHHVFARTVKDLFCRHRAMLGFHVPRKAGWDTHGLPVEIEVEKALGISGKQDIEALGVERFNALCRESVWKYRGEWERLCERVAHWMDYEHPYVTYSNDYIESVWWALKALFDRGLLYKGYKILPYCPRCGTALSSHEVAQGYDDVEDPSIFIAVDLMDGEAATRRRLIVWTTTPWTLVSNVALAVHPGHAYLELRKRGATPADWTIILGESRAGAILGADYVDRWDVVARMGGTALVGRRYRRPLDWVPFPPNGGAHEVVIGAEFVSADDGSGIVHMAPAFGADDYAAGQQHGLAMLQPVNARGHFDATVPVVGGQWVKDADPAIIHELRQRDALWKASVLTHAYPHCWRCRTPLLYYARESWFIKTTAFRDEMLDRNGHIAWHPADVGAGRFGEWLKNNVDWAISRDRYWGTPLPVWVCEDNPNHIEVIGSYHELAERIGAPLPADFDPHKPFVDRWTWECRACANAWAASPGRARPRMRRVHEVIDAWFDSGSMPFAQWHYPFENADVLRHHYPADFIAEGLDQTRGWFYSLLAIAAGLGDALPNNSALRERSDTAPYRTVVVNDMVLDASGVKMSKSRGNVVDPFEVVTKYGVDAVRLFLVASSQLGAPKRFDEAQIREVATGFFLTLRNVYSGIFAEYANFGWEPSANDPPVAERPLLDRWILSRLSATMDAANEALLAFDATTATRTLMSFVTDDVSNWYIRQTRGRFYDVTTASNRAAFATLHEILVTASRLLAPIAPYLSDWLHRQLTGDSVHLASYVPAAGAPREPELEAAMSEIRELSRLGRAAREEIGLNVRRPLSRAMCVVPPLRHAGVTELLPILEAELNVKQAVLVSSADGLVTLEAKPNFRSLGKKFGKSTPLAAKAVQALSAADLARFEVGEEVAVTVDGVTKSLERDDLEVVRRAAGSLVVKESEGRFCAVDPTVTEALRREGLARELVSRLQRLRRDEGLAVSDRIRLWLRGDAEIETAAAEYIGWLSGEVLAKDIAIGGDGFPADRVTHELEIDGLRATVAITRDY
jgi:isoleucyl-tRNA synthetase